MSLKDIGLEKSAPTVAHADLIDLKQMSEADLLRLRNRIDKLIVIDLKHVNLSEELGLQYRAGKQLLSDVQDTVNAPDPMDRVPANQRAQVFNSVSSMLDKIVKMQEAVYSTDRLKLYEVAFKKSLETLPPEAKIQFFDLYGSYLKEGVE